MSRTSDTEKRIAGYIRRMKKAMPKVKQEIAVYELALKNGIIVKSPKTAPQFNHG